MGKFYFNIAQVGNNICVREYDDEDGEIQYKNKFQPRLFLPSNKEDTKYRGLKDEPLKEVNPGGIYDSKEYLKLYRNVNGFSIYGNNNFPIQYISENYKGDIHANITKIRRAFIDIEVGCDKGFPKPDDADFPITAITLYDSFTKKYYVFDYGDWELENTELDFVNEENVVYYGCSNEKRLLESFLSVWEQMGFHVVTHWNGDLFDIPYIVNRIKKVLGDKSIKRLSPWGVVKEKQIRGMYGKTYNGYDIVGITSLDYLSLYKKYTYKIRESYTLDYISHVELKERKLSYDEAGSLFNLFKINPQKHTDYNIKDVNLILRLDEKMKLLDLVFFIAYYAKINYQDTFSPVRTWDTIIYNYLLERNIIVPPSKVHIKDSSFGGAYVKDPICGKHKWIMSFDLNSLYPHLIMQYNLGPDTLIEKDDLPEDLWDLKNAVNIMVRDGKRHVDPRLINKEIDTSALKNHNITLAANNQYFRTDKKSFLSVMMESLYKERKANKKKMLGFKQDLVNEVDEAKKIILKNQIARYDNLQKAQKILLNSCYGGIGTPYFRFYDIRVAEAITISGQLSLLWIAKRLNNYLNELMKTEDKDYVIAGDTDSVYINFGDLVDKFFTPNAEFFIKDEKIKIVNFLDKVAKQKIQPFIEKCYKELAEYMNVYENKMVMGREVIAESGVWVAKKRYILNVWDSEGVRYKEPKLKIMGVEAKKSSTPEICRKKLKEAYKIILSGTEEELIKFVEIFKSEWKTLAADEIAFPRSVNNLEKYSDSSNIFKKGSPKHVKGSLIFNHLVNKKKLTDNIELINEGEKIKFVDLFVPNPGMDKVIAFKNFLPKELDMDKYINYDIMFEKSFLSPLQSMLDLIGWHHEHVASLLDFFAIE